MAPRKNLPRIIRGPGARSIPQLKKRGYKKAGSKYGRNVYVLPKAPPKPAPKPVPTPYEQYRETAPWAIGLLQDLDKSERRHTGYVTGEVMPWLSQGLAALTGVDPKAPGFNPTVQQQYLANIQGAVGNALNAAAAATPPTVAPTTPGGTTVAPQSFLGTAMGQYAAQRGGAAIMEAQGQQAINTLQANTFAQGALRSIADYAAGLPTTYVQKRNELRANIDQWVAEQEFQKAQFAEQQRAARVDESIRALNAQTQAALGFGQLGLEAGDVPTMPPTGLPPGFVVVPNDSGGWDIERDPSFVEPSGGTDGGTSTRDAQGRPRIEALREKGFIGGWKTPTKARKLGFTNLTQASDSLWYGKRPSAEAAKAAKPKTTTKLQEELLDLYKPGDIGGWEERYDQKPLGAAVEVARWARQEKRHFIKGPVSGRRVDAGKLDAVIRRVGGQGRVYEETMRILRGYMTADGRWK